MGERVGEADRGEPEAALLHRDAAGFVEQRLAVARPDDQRVHGAQHLEGAVEALDAPLLRLQRAGLLQQLVDHHAQVLLVEVAADLRRRFVARGERGVHLAQDLVVVGGLEQHARHAVRLRQRLRLLTAEVRGVEHHRGRRGGRIGLQPARQLVAVHHRHQHVGDHQLGAGLLRARQRLAAVDRAHHGMPG